MPASPTFVVETPPVLAEVDIEDIDALAYAARQADGISPFSEQTLIEVRRESGRESAVHIVVRVRETEAKNVETRLIGYAYLDISDEHGYARAELCVHPRYRGVGIGHALVMSALEASHDRLRIWVHGKSRPAEHLAQQFEFTPVRQLWQMRRSLNDSSQPVPDIHFPLDVSIRTFEAGQDNDNWLKLNTLAFANHPEQGKWTKQDLQDRVNEAWFSNEGFFLAFRGDNLIASVWTKVHSTSTKTAADDLGEIYVVSTHPAEQGMGLGSALTVHALRYLERLGLKTAMLYVDADNAAAVRVYSRFGFEIYLSSVMYEHGSLSSTTCL